jgi:outer membrane protein assembly factor BamB
MIDMRRLYPVLMTVLILLGRTTAAGEDWPNFRGPRHDGIARESVTALTKTNPTWKECWRREIGAGFSSFAVANGRVFTAGTEEKHQTLYALDEKTGVVRWKLRLEPEMTDPDPNLHGPRATPTVNEGLVFYQGALGRLVCLDAATGALRWEMQFTHRPNWGYSASVLIDADAAIVSPGGSDGALLALDKKTGNILWKCGDEAAAYATPYPFELDGRRYVVAFMARHVIVAERATGRKVLAFDWPSHSGVNVAGPIVHDGHLLVSTGYGYGAGLFRLRRVGDALEASEVWKSAKLRNKMQTPILIDGHLYTSDESAFKCVNFLTGAVLWQKRGIVHGPLLAVGDRLLLLKETGELQIGRADTSGFTADCETSLFEGSTRTLLQQLTRQRQGRRCWTVPVLANGRLFARDHDTAICIDFTESPR